MYKPVFALLLFVVSNLSTFSQKNEPVLSAPENWQSELIPFPLGFAPAIDFTGFEDLRFSPHWADSTSQQFWSYAFVWYIEKEEAMTEERLTESFTQYYDGLMAAVAKADTTHPAPPAGTFCLFIKTSEGFTGKMRVFDAFFSKDYMTLNIQVKELYCSETNRQAIFCTISPKALDHAVWKIFDAVKLKVKCD